MPTIVKYSSDLYHSGIKGMKWGVRRYQNEDGSLTPAGKLRYGVGERDNRTYTKDDISKMEKTRKERIRYNKLRTRQMNKVAKGRTSGMSDRDIASYNERLTQEANRSEQVVRIAKAKQQRKLNAMKAGLEVLKTTTGILVAGAALKTAINKNYNSNSSNNNNNNSNNNSSNDKNKNNGQGSAQNNAKDEQVIYQYNKTVNKAPLVQIGGEKKKKKGD